MFVPYNLAETGRNFERSGETKLRKNIFTGGRLKPAVSALHVLHIHRVCAGGDCLQSTDPQLPPWIGHVRAKQEKITVL